MTSINWSLRYYSNDYFPGSIVFSSSCPLVLSFWQPTNLPSGGHSSGTAYSTLLCNISLKSVGHSSGTSASASASASGHSSGTAQRCARARVLLHFGIMRIIQVTHCLNTLVHHHYSMQNITAHFDTNTTTQCINVLALCTITLWATLRHCAHESRETRNTRRRSAEPEPHYGVKFIECEKETKEVCKKYF